jgi:hypothetical protein
MMDIVIHPKNKSANFFPTAHYDDGKSNAIIFLQGDPYHHATPGLLETIWQTLIHGTFHAMGSESLAGGSPQRPFFLHLNQRRFFGSSRHCVSNILEQLGLQKEQIFGSYCCSQFVANRAAVFHKSKDSGGESGVTVNSDGEVTASEGSDSEEGSLLLHPVYENARKVLNKELSYGCSEDTSHDSRPGIAVSAMFEHVWHIAFKQPGYLPMRSNDYSLPPFLRTEGKDPMFGHLQLKALVEDRGETGG